MSARTARYMLLVAAVLIVWGPPTLRLAGRELDAALANPFALDTAGLLVVGAWVFADALVALLLLSHLARRTHFLSELLSDHSLRWYGLYGVLGLASMAYSSSPIYTAFFAQKIVVGILVLALLEWHWPSRHGSQAMQVLFCVFSLQAAAIGILYFTQREWVTPFGSGGGSDVRVTGGVFADYGESGLLAGLFFLAVALSARAPRHRLLASGAYLGSWALIVLSQTRATMAAGVAFLVIMLHAHPRARVHGSLIATGLGVAIVALLPGVLQDIISTGTRRGEGLETLSGRTVAFSYLIERWQESPLIGYGFAAGARNLLIDFVAREQINIGAGHDALSTVLVDLGLIGFALLLASFIAAWAAFWRLYQTAASHWQASLSAHQIACLLLWVTFRAVVDKSVAGWSEVFVVAIVATWAVGKLHPIQYPHQPPVAAAIIGSQAAARSRTP
jgi:O-Antigen ligase